MKASVFILALLAIIPTATPVSAACSGADPAITSVAVKDSTSDGRVTDYTILGMVKNLGRKAQTSNVLQFVDVYENGIRLDSKSILPLAPGQSRPFTYIYQRSTDAGNGTSHLEFKLRFRNPVPPGSMNCDTSNDKASLTV